MREAPLLGPEKKIADGTCGVICSSTAERKKSAGQPSAEGGPLRLVGPRVGLSQEGVPVPLMVNRSLICFGVGFVGLVLMIPICCFTASSLLFDNRSENMLRSSLVSVGFLSMIVAVLLVMGLIGPSIWTFYWERRKRAPRHSPIVEQDVHSLFSGFLRNKGESIRVAVIANPNAGRGRGVEIVESLLIPRLREKDNSISVSSIAFTEGFDSAGKIATGLSPCPDLIVVVGGDGTFNEVVNGLLTKREKIMSTGSNGYDPLPTMAIVPMGSANSLFSHFFFSNSTPVALRLDGERRLWGDGWERMKQYNSWAIERICCGFTAKVDLLECEVVQEKQPSDESSNPFVFASNSIFVGLLLEVNIFSEKCRRLGYWRYDIAAILCLYHLRTTSAILRLRTGESWTQFHEAFYFISIDKVQHWEDCRRASYAAQLDDGLVQVSFVRAPRKRRELITLLLQLEKGTHWQSQLLEQHTAEEVELVFDSSEERSSGLFSADGEFFVHSGRLRVRVLPRVMPLIVGETNY